MKTDLIVILATNKGEVSTTRPVLEIVGHYLTETDDQPGLSHVMKDVEYADERNFFALIISPDRSVSIRCVQSAPRFGMEVDAVGPHPTEPPEPPERNALPPVRNRTGRCWGCENNSSRPQQHTKGCPKGVPGNE